MTRVRRELVGGPALGRSGSRAPRSTWIVVATLSSLGVCGCPVDDRALAKRPGLVFLPGGGADGVGVAGRGSGGGGSGGDGSEAGQMEAGQPGFSTGGTDFSTGGTDAGAAGSGGSEQAGQDGAGGSSGAGVVAGTTGVALGGAGGNPAGGAGAGGGSGGHLMGRCPDLDDNFVFDCDETIAKNFGFDEDTSDWSTETNLVLAWQVLDAAGHSDSGSLSVEDTFTTDIDGSLMLGARQCIPVSEQTLYAFAVQASVPDGATGTTAGFQLIVYNDDDCMGSMVDIATSSVVSGSSWNVAKLVHPMPKFAKSVVMRLVTIKPYREAPNSVLFDNVLVHQVSASSP